MRKIFKLIGIFVIIIFLLIIVVWISHKVNLSKEDKLFIPNGQIVEVNGYKMHVYGEGDGDIPLVFMSGGGTSSPVLDFKSLYSLLSDEYKIVVVEKVGYGFSDIVDIERNIDSILDDTRKALSIAENNGPYILFPHSMSGIEALYWAHKYPDEINAIIGLDMAVPEAYKEYKINIPMINEVKEIKINANKVSESPLPNIPILMFSSNGQGTGWNEDEWRNFQKNAIDNLEQGEIIYLDCSHYIHAIEYKKIAEESKRFIESLKYE